MGRRTWYALAMVLTVSAAPSSAADELRGEINADGSSTVYLITEAMAKQFKRQHPRVNISVGISGTGGGFKKFINGETDLQNASRAITEEEKKQCLAKGIDFLELLVAWDGLTVVIHPENHWARKMTAQQLRQIWHPEVAAKKWSDVDPSWPDQEIRLFGAGPDSGTFDAFTAAINGKERLSRKDYEASEDDNVIARGVAGNRYALGYFGLAYYEANKGQLTAVAIAEKPGGPYVLPSVETVQNREYRPLARPLYIYIKKSSLRRPEFREFVRYYLRNRELVQQARYVPVTTRQQDKLQRMLEEAIAALNK